MSQHQQNISQDDHSKQISTQTPSLQEQHHGNGEGIERLASNIRGKVILPADAAYEDARQVWNGAFDCHPAAIVRCMDAEDVKAVVNFARKQEMPLSVRSGGHSASGDSTNDNGVVIDLSDMKGITVDPVRRTARLEPGLTSGEVANTLQPYGLALTSGDTASVGIGGLLLGGGIGWMVREYGLALDHVRAVELVTADGHLLRASAQEHPELFWGLRGGGGNFGVATAFEVNLNPVGTILGGAVFYEATEAEHILQEYARLATEAPDELTTEALFMLAPPAPFIPANKQGTPVIAILLCYTGDLIKGERVVAPLRQLATPLADMVMPMPYTGIFRFTEIGEVRGLQHHDRSLFVKTFSEEIVHVLVEASQSIMSPETVIQLRVLGGAMSRVASDATAFSHRDKQGLVAIVNTGPVSANPAALEARTQHVFEALSPYANGVYVNFLEDEGEQRVREAYSPATYARLVALKNQYDPTNLFHLNQNIRPAL